MASTEADRRRKMAENSIAWHTASPEEKKRLEEENQFLGSLGGAGTYDPNTGKWSGLVYGSDGYAVIPDYIVQTYDYNTMYNDPGMSRRDGVQSGSGNVPGQNSKTDLPILGTGLFSGGVKLDEQMIAKGVIAYLAIMLVTRIFGGGR
jgi:hypothetical protein